MLAGAAIGAASAVLAAEVLERARDLSLPAVYVVTGFTILMIGACLCGVRTWFLSEGGKAAYRVMGSWRIFLLIVLPLTTVAVLGYSSAHLGDWLLGRPEPVACGLLGASLGAVASVPIRRTCLWWLGPAPIEDDPEP
jgi:hypothetical protein